MLQRIENLPREIWGVRAIGKVSKSDYDSTMLPELDAARRDGHRLRLLYQFGSEFEGFTAGGAWEDARLGVQYLRLFERCAVVTDIDWIRTATKAAAAIMPCPVKVFANGEWNEAVAWLSAELQPSVSYRMLPDRGVLVIEPHGPLSAHDFDVLSAETDAWIESGDSPLTGIVIHARRFQAGRTSEACSATSVSCETTTAKSHAWPCPPTRRWPESPPASSITSWRRRRSATTTRISTAPLRGRAGAPNGRSTPRRRALLTCNRHGARRSRTAEVSGAFAVRPEGGSG
jgi:hypothetical protein